MDARTRALVKVNTEDVLAAIGWQNTRLRRWLAAALLRGPALRFAREMTAFDDEVARRGIRAAAAGLLASFVRRLDVHGIGGIPPTGPALLLSNHPGMTDTLVLLSAIPRDDLLIIAAERPFLTALPAAAASLILLPDQRERRLPALRRAVGHLAAGGALLTFPAGEIEPDPDALPGAAAAVRRWSASSLSFLKRAPDCVVVPLIVRGVLQPRAQRNPLARLRQRRADRERLAAMLQVLVHELAPGAWRTHVTLEVLPPMSAAGLLSRGPAAHDALTAVVAEHLRRRARARPGSSAPAHRR